MRDTISIYNKRENISLPDNLANFRDVTMSDRDKREQVCNILGIILNWNLGWLVDNRAFETAVNAISNPNQYQLEQLNSIAPIRFTDSFRLAPGEAKRVAQRLKYVPLVWSSCRGGWYNNGRRIVASNKQLIEKDTQSPSVVINRYKLRGSRNNWFRENALKVNNEFWSLLESDHWEDIIRRYIDQLRRPQGYHQNTYSDLYLRNMVSVDNNNGGNWTYNDTNDIIE